MTVDERTLFNRTRHGFFPLDLALALLAPALHDHSVGSLVVAGLETLGQLTPWRAGMPATGRAPLTTTHRVIDRVHRDAAVVRATTEPARATGFADRDVGVVDVRDLADRRAAIEVDHADFA